MRLAYHVMSAPPPLGLLFLARTVRGLRFTEFMDRKSIKRMIARYEDVCPGATWEASLLEMKPIVDQLEAFFHGSLTEFSLPLDPVGSEFQLTVWNELCRIPYGRTRSYGEIAQAIGQPRAARAVGLANHDNPIAIVVPCHRVIGADGSLTGYGGGLPRKRWLLQHEARFAIEAGLVAPRAARPAPAPRPRAVAVAKPAPVSRARAVAVAKPAPGRTRPAVAKPAKTRSSPTRVARSGARATPAARTPSRSTSRRHSR